MSRRILRSCKNKSTNCNNEQGIIEYKVHKKKCGEVFIHENDLFSFLCTMCEAPFEELQNFFSHILQNHKEKDECKEDKKTDVSWYNARILNHESNAQVPKIDDVEVEPDIPNYIREVDLVSDENSSDESTDTIAIESSKKCMKEESDDEYEPNVSFQDCTLSSDDKKTNKIVANEKKQQQRSKQITCLSCGKIFASETSLKRHRKTVKCECKSEKKEIISSYICDICGKEFRSKRSLEEHKYFTKRGHNLGTNVEYQTDEAVAKKLAKLLKVSESEGYSLKCRYCDKTLADSSKRSEHERIHTGEKPFQCQICGKQFRTRALCTTHEGLHTTERLHKCEICGMTFKNKQAVYTHSQRHGEKTIQCNYCDKLFFNKSERKEHERIHTGEKPYVCQYCGKCFQTSGSLNTHSRKHLNIRPHKCQYCDRSFYTKPMLRNHIVIHTGERPYVCEICNATFQRRKGLSSHEKIHSELRNYVCRICGSAFKQYSGLYLHMRNHGENLAKLTKKQQTTT